MKEMTHANLSAAFAGESQAHMKYLNFAEQARKEGLPNVARIFEAASFAEQMHASNHLRALSGIQDTVTNLGVAKGGEDFEIAEMYPAYKGVAELQAEKQPLRSMTWAMEAELVHSKLYGDAKAKVEAKQDAADTPIWVCMVCGYTGEGEPPEVCPVCGTKHGKFRTF